jgi:threonine/homoserine/homoserine lactone efflux protein
MLPTEHLLAFVLIAVVLILVPGPSVLFVVTRSLTLGPRAGLATVVGNATGVYVQAVAVAAYLVYLGVQTFRHRRSLAAALDAPVQRKLVRRILADAFVVGVFNPKVIVFFMAILPQFVDRSAGAVPVQLLLLGAIFCLLALVCDSLWALAAGVARAWLVGSPRRLEAIGGTGGVVMIGLGAGLALTGRKE